ncbi:unnamed protein product, partial [Discosporangium mesarthrocarpum]
MGTPRPLAATHPYLGDLSSEVGGRDSSLLEEGDLVEIPILSLEGVVLFPNETLPLRLRNQAYVALARGTMSGQGVSFMGEGRRGTRVVGQLGVVNRLVARSGGLLIRTVAVGTTADIRSWHLGDGGDSLVLMARGRHRFRLVEDRGWRRGVRIWKVHITPNLCPGPPPLVGPRSLNLSRRHWALAAPPFAWASHSPHTLAARASAMVRKTQMWGGLGGNAEGVRSSEERQAREHNSVGVGVEQEGGEGRLAGSGGFVGGEAGEPGGDPDGLEGRKVDPTILSFWLGANLPLQDTERHEQLQMDSVVARLRRELEYLEVSSKGALCCIWCETPVALQEDVFVLPGAEGVVGAYVNPEGFVHQTVTLRQAHNLSLEGQPVTQDSWFPGYAWTSVRCNGCWKHLGWHFLSVNQLVPAVVQGASPLLLTLGRLRPEDAQAAASGEGEGGGSTGV